jgi:hypothetical protein
MGVAKMLALKKFQAKFVYSKSDIDSCQLPNITDDIDGDQWVKVDGI